MNSKLLTLSLLIFIFYTSLGLAQDQNQKFEPYYGFRMGVNYSTILSDNFDLIAAGLGTTEDKAENYRIGATVGFLAEYRLTDKFSVQPEIQYSTQGNTNQELRLNYIQVPVLAKFNLSDAFNVHIGPQGGFKVWEWERNEVYSNFELSALAGLGLNITDNFFADLRYSYGFTNIFEGAEADDESEIEGVNSYFQFTLGYRL